MFCAVKRFITNKLFKMAKLYSQYSKSKQIIKPKEETIQFLLNYSKALSVIHCNKLKIEILLN